MSLQDLRQATDYIQKQAAKGGGGAVPGILPMGKMFHPTQWFANNPFAGVATAAGLGGAALGYLNSDDNDWKDALAGGALGVGAAGLLNQMGAFGGLAGKGKGNQNQGGGDKSQEGGGKKSGGDGGNRGQDGGGNQSRGQGGGGGNQGQASGGGNQNQGKKGKGGNTGPTEEEKKLLAAYNALSPSEAKALGKSQSEMAKQRQFQEHMARVGSQKIQTSEAMRKAKANKEMLEQMDALTGSYSSGAGIGPLRRLWYRFGGG